MFLCLCELSFTWGHNEDYSPGSSEKLLQRGRGGKLIYVTLVKGDFSAIKHLSYERFSASQEELMSP